MDNFLEDNKQTNDSFCKEKCSLKRTRIYG